MADSPDDKPQNRHPQLPASATAMYGKPLKPTAYTPASKSRENVKEPFPGAKSTQPQDVAGAISPASHAPISPSRRNKAVKQVNGVTAMRMPRGGVLAISEEDRVIGELAALNQKLKRVLAGHERVWEAPFATETTDTGVSGGLVAFEPGRRDTLSPQRVRGRVVGSSKALGMSNSGSPFPPAVHPPSLPHATSQTSAPSSQTSRGGYSRAGQQATQRSSSSPGDARRKLDLGELDAIETAQTGTTQQAPSVSFDDAHDDAHDGANDGESGDGDSSSTSAVLTSDDDMDVAGLRASGHTSRRQEEVHMAVLKRTRLEIRQQIDRQRSDGARLRRESHNSKLQLGQGFIAGNQSANAPDGDTWSTDDSSSDSSDDEGEGDSSLPRAGLSDVASLRRQRQQRLLAATLAATPGRSNGGFESAVSVAALTASRVRHAAAQRMASKELQLPPQVPSHSPEAERKHRVEEAWRNGQARTTPTINTAYRSAPQSPPQTLVGSYAAGLRQSESARAAAEALHASSMDGVRTRNTGVSESKMIDEPQVLGRARAPQSLLPSRLPKPHRRSTERRTTDQGRSTERRTPHHRDSPSRSIRKGESGNRRDYQKRSRQPPLPRGKSVSDRHRSSERVGTRQRSPMRSQRAAAALERHMRRSAAARSGIKQQRPTNRRGGQTRHRESRSNAPGDRRGGQTRHRESRSNAPGDRRGGQTRHRHSDRVTSTTRSRLTESVGRNRTEEWRESVGSDSVQSSVTDREQTRRRYRSQQYQSDDGDASEKGKEEKAVVARSKRDSQAPRPHADSMQILSILSDVQSRIQNLEQQAIPARSTIASSAAPNQIQRSVPTQSSTTDHWSPTDPSIQSTPVSAAPEPEDSLVSRVAALAASVAALSPVRAAASTPSVAAVMQAATPKHPQHFDSAKPGMSPAPTNTGTVTSGLYAVLAPFSASGSTQANTLAVSPGQYVQLIMALPSGWWFVRRQHDGMQGYVPGTFLAASSSRLAIANTPAPTSTTSSQYSSVATSLPSPAGKQDQASTMIMQPSAEASSPGPTASLTKSPGPTASLTKSPGPTASLTKSPRPSQPPKPNLVSPKFGRLRLQSGSSTPSPPSSPLSIRGTSMQQALLPVNPILHTASTSLPRMGGSSAPTPQLQFGGSAVLAPVSQLSTSMSNSALTLQASPPPPQHSPPPLSPQSMTQTPVGSRLRPRSSPTRPPGTARPALHSSSSQAVQGINSTPVYSSPHLPAPAPAQPPAQPPAPAPAPDATVSAVTPATRPSLDDLPTPSWSDDDSDMAPPTPIPIKTTAPAVTMPDFPDLDTDDDDDDDDVLPPSPMPRMSSVGASASPDPSPPKLPKPPSTVKPSTLASFPSIESSASDTSFSPPPQPSPHAQTAATGRRSITSRFGSMRSIGSSVQSATSRPGKPLPESSVQSAAYRPVKPLPESFSVEDMAF